jgi:tetratricopeptide (TPR) repeat protein
MAQLNGTLTRFFSPVNLSASDSCVTRGTIAKVIFLWHFDVMKFLCVAGLLFAGLVLSARAQSEADDKYLSIYGLIQQADGLATSGDPGEALAAFDDAQNQLQQFQKSFPDWNPNIVSFRLNHITDEIAELKSHAAMVATAKKSVAAAVPVAPPVAAVAPPTDQQMPSELDNLRTQLQVAQAANDIWQAKLKEALAVQPAAVDPRELAQAQEKIRALMKQIDLLNAGRGLVTSAPPVAVLPAVVTNFTTVFVTNPPAPATVFVTNTIFSSATNFATVYLTNNYTVVVTNFSNAVIVDTNALEMARLDRAAAIRNFNDEHERAEKLADELARLRQNPGGDTNSAATIAALRAENESLKSELATVRAAMPATNGDDKLAAELKTSQALVTALRSQLEVASLEKISLQNKLQELAVATNAVVNTVDYEARIRDLTQQRDGLIEKLDAANNRKSGQSLDLSAQIAGLNEQVGALRARLAVIDAAAIPYTADELALLKSSVPAANPDAEKKSIAEMPAGTAELVASAQTHFVHQEYDAAEADYLKILDRDQNNGIALANLATIELQQGKLDDADKHLTAALKQSPDDAYNLSTLGYLKFRQEKYDDALKALSHAEQIDPNNPEIENYLGVTLSHQGQRKAAETALRRAIQLNPNYAPAHNNLAVIYLSQTPPLAELARWHYQKALDNGQPHNPELEKMLADKGAPIAQ